MDGIDGGPGIGSQEADSHMPCVYFIPNSGDTGPSGNSRGIPGMPAHWEWPSYLDHWSGSESAS
eukprot:2557447-Alexandrium_andersonii.AAC.1